MFLLMMGLLSGCGDARPGSAPERLSDATLNMITRTGDYPEQLWRVTLADEALTQRCMRAAGYNWSGGAIAPVPESDTRDLANARRHGYGLSDPPAPAETPAQTGDEAGLRAALFGPDNSLSALTIDDATRYLFPRSGCAASAHKKIYGSLDTWARITYIPQETNLVVASQAIADPRYLAATQRWSACMATHHFTYDSPMDVASKLVERYRTDREPLARRRTTEITLAVQDMTCRQQAALRAAQAELTLEYAQKLAPAKRAELTQLTTLFAKARKRAHDIQQ
jgi:hypothetical protein